ncbi:Glucose dehydrogenase [FAD, quinone] [Araneus ventricosus]|uniref:Glucose dehydrogenase [FAD, quinone] n=1 Tax=Araneus ventricosus TaxID=182803 RepID=A0A4Y2KNJ9_ARAVE|nr:Glucose dehydrogenase [FAD, quinone] [Araneus ventricosus]
MNTRKEIHVQYKLIQVPGYENSVLSDISAKLLGIRFFDKQGIIFSSVKEKTPTFLNATVQSSSNRLNLIQIEVIADLRVGDNLQDHVGNLVLNFEAKHAEPIFWKEAALPSNILRYKLHATGPYTSLCGIEGLAFLNTKYNDARLDWPDAEIHLLSGSVATDYTQAFRQRIGLPEEVYDKVYKPYIGKNSFSFFPALLRPKSRGAVRLKSDDPYEYPLIDFNLFQYEEDLDKVVDIMKQCVNIVANTTAFKKIAAKMFTIKVPGCENYEIYSDNYLRCLARDYPFNAYHPSGTCKMGDADDETTVVDPELK